jgi:hypothetical protein
MKNVVRLLYQLARTMNTLSVLLSGNPRRIARRGKNIVLGRALGRAGAWRRVW